MADRAVVASELEQIADHFRRCANVYPDLGFEEREQAVRDALALLKEKEAVEPVKENYWPRTYGRCGKCKAPLPAIEGFQSKFCWMCGRRVKWDAD